MATVSPPASETREAIPNLSTRLANRGRNFVRRTKLRMFEFALGEALGVLGHASEQNLARIGQVFGLFAKEPNQRMVAQWLKTYLSAGHPGAAYVRRLFADVDPNVRRRYIARFIANVVFHDSKAHHYLANGCEVPQPATIVISPTMRCNLRCTGCYAANYTKDSDMPRETLERIISEARELGTRFFVISGGEPLIYEPLFDVFKKFDDCAFQFYTSGHLLTPQKAREIVELGNVVPAVSIEGFEAETELRRGTGGFQRVMRAMDMLREARALFAFSVTVTRLNVDVVTSDEFIDLMIEKGATYGWYFTYIPIGSNPDISYMPTPQQRNQLRAANNRIRNTKPILVGDFWNDGGLTEGCLSGGRRYLHINNKGDVEPCVFFHFATDNVSKKPLAECLTSDFFRALRKAAPFGTNLLRPCPIIDRPQVLRGLVSKFGAYPTHEGAETLRTTLAPALDQYAAGLKEVYDPVWTEEYQWVAMLHGKDKYKEPR